MVNQGRYPAEAADPFCLRDGEAAGLLAGHPWRRFAVLGDSIAQGLGRSGEAEPIYREVQGKFLELGKSYDAALVSLDLARLLAAEGCTDDLKRLAAELMPVFESRDVHREAIVALLIFQRACEEERLTVELVQQLAAYLRRERRG